MFRYHYYIQLPPVCSCKDTSAALHLSVYLHALLFALLPYFGLAH